MKDSNKKDEDELTGREYFLFCKTKKSKRNKNG